MKHFSFQKLILLLFLCSTLNSFAQRHAKSLYVNDFKNIVGNAAAEDELLNFAVDSNYQYLILYNLYFIHNNMFDITDPLTATPLSDFIYKAKEVYGIPQIGAVGETFASFNTIHDYNMDNTGDIKRQFTAYNIEYEFWNSGSTGPGGYYCTTYLTPNGYTCDTAGAFQHYIKQLCKLDSLTNSPGAVGIVLSETYIGNPTPGQCSQISDCADRILVHYYRPSDLYSDGSSIYNFKSYRLPALANSINLAIVYPIFNCRPDFMGPWLDTVSHTQAFETWYYAADGFDADTGSWKENLIVEGSVWYRYTCMHDTTGTVTSNYEQAIISEISVYPNPTKKTLNVRSTKDKLYLSEIEIIDELGRIIDVPYKLVLNNRIEFDVDHLKAGIYWIKINELIKPFVIQ